MICTLDKFRSCLISQNEGIPFSRYHSGTMALKKTMKNMKLICKV